MSLADYANYVRRRDTPRQCVQDTKVSLTVVAGKLYSGWLQTPNGGAAPTTAAVPTDATVGAMPFNKIAANYRVMSSSIWTLNQGVLIVMDRLSHQGGLSGAVALTAQTTNLPTSALTRYTSGVGVMAFLEVYTAVGATGTTVTASYTNQAGTAAQTSLATAFGATGFNGAGVMLQLPLAIGDTGVKSVESVTTVASSGTAGNFGVTLARPIFAIPMRDNTTQATIDHLFSMGFVPEIVASACLMRAYRMVTASTSVVQDSYNTAED